MSDHHTAGSLRHHADKNVTVPTKPGSQIGILGDGFVRKMSAGQHVNG
jgi:predicted RNA binding protein YcfA (HicA-like mRNA interferase family)